MRGFPPIQIFVLGLLFGLLAVPLVRLTGNAPRPVDEEHASGAQDLKGGGDHPQGEHKQVKVPAIIRLRYAHKPLSISLKSNGEELLTNLDLSKPVLEIKAEIEVSHDGNELSLEAQWPEGTPDTAMTVEIEPEGFETRTQTRWSSDTKLSEILTLIW
ncbi:MAG: hypothetical protein V4662_03095 [Verrucomicrobiota bacterium]